MKNRIIRVTIITLVVYIFYVFFYVEDIVDGSMNQNNHFIESNDVTIETDTVFVYNDVLDSIPKEKLMIESDSSKTE
ncbi:MAG: Uncharacterised protein [Flavobacterium sp. SCGC AAA160-P02]|nr:MAG: Uncharacterised protein [Flavobacterium sp. SCGC AAA160-P02]